MARASPENIQKMISAQTKRKPTKAALETRITETMRMLVEGKKRQEIIAYAEAHKWGVQPRQVDNYIVMATNKIISMSEQKRTYLVGQAHARLETLFTEHVASKRLRDALSVQKEINELFGLHAPARTININVDLVGELYTLLEESGTDPEEFFAKAVSKLKAKNTRHEP